MSSRAFTPVVLLASLALLAPTACTTVTPATEIVVVVDSDLAVPGAVDAIEIIVEGLGADTQSATAVLRNEGDLPTTSTLVYRGGPLGPITVTATARLAGTAVLERTARVSFIRDTSAVLELHLVAACVAASCGALETCAPDGCRPIDVAAEELGTWTGTPPRLGVDAGPPMDTAPPDVGADASDAGMDAPPDAGTDAAEDAGSDTGVDAGPTRVTEGLVVLYEFDEGSGDTVRDTSGVGTPLNLSVADPAAVSWMPGALSINVETALLSSSPGTKVYAACTASNELTVEAWLTPIDAVQFGPARFVGLTEDPNIRNFMIGQSGASWTARLRTTNTDDDGAPDLDSADGTAGPSLTHVVFTATTEGVNRIVIDGVVSGSTTRLGDYSNWNPTYLFVLANEATLDRPWLGTMHLVAVYDRALSLGEIRQNYSAGP